MKKVYVIIAVVLVALSLLWYNSAEKTADADDKKVEYGPYMEDYVVSVSVTAAGDCTLGSDVSFGRVGTFDAEYINNNEDCTYFLKNVKPYFENDDLTIVNLEGALSDKGLRRIKKFAFRGNPEYVNILTSASLEVANLANNHSADYGDEALEDTQKILSENGVLPVGPDDYEIKDIKGMKVGIVGINALLDWAETSFVQTLDKLKLQNPDLVIAVFHWGIEKSVVPNKRQVRLAHMAIDNGVDLVIGHHPHVLQGIEKYKGKYIAYSLGNFCFGGNKNPVDKDTMIFKQTFTFLGGELVENDEVSVVPCSVSSVANRNDFKPTPLNGAQFERVKNKIIRLSSSFYDCKDIKFSIQVK